MHSLVHLTWDQIHNPGESGGGSNQLSDPTRAFQHIFLNSRQSCGKNDGGAVVCDSKPRNTTPLFQRVKRIFNLQGGEGRVSGGKQHEYNRCLKSPPAAPGGWASEPQQGAFWRPMPNRGGEAGVAPRGWASRPARKLMQQARPAGNLSDIPCLRWVPSSRHPKRSRLSLQCRSGAFNSQHPQNPLSPPPREPPAPTSFLPHPARARPPHAREPALPEWAHDASPATHCLP